MLLEDRGEFVFIQVASGSSDSVPTLSKICEMNEQKNEWVGHLAMICGMSN